MTFLSNKGLYSNKLFESLQLYAKKGLCTGLFISSVNMVARCVSVSFIYMPFCPSATALKFSKDIHSLLKLELAWAAKMLSRFVSFKHFIVCLPLVKSFKWLGGDVFLIYFGDVPGMDVFPIMIFVTIWCCNFLIFGSV